MEEVTRQLRHSLKDCPIDASGVNVTRLFVVFVVFVKSGRLQPLSVPPHCLFAFFNQHFTFAFNIFLPHTIYFLCLLIQI
jgi:hypothetical protein